MSRRKHKHEDHINHEAWAIPYGDLITLLLAFFVVMYAISSVNEGKYRVLSDSLVAAFRGSPRTLQPVQVGSKQVGSGADIEISIVQQAMLDGQPRSLMQVHAFQGPEGPAAKAMRRMAEEVEVAMSHLIEAKLVAVRRTAQWVEVEVRTDILFPSGSAEIAEAAKPVLAQIAATLSPLPNPIRVEGHTDNVPIRSGSYPSNWELSAARAASVVHLFTDNGIAAGRLSVAAFGEQRPVQSNDTAEGRNANRRVLIVITGGDPEPPQASPVVPGEGATAPASAPASPVAPIARAAAEAGTEPAAVNPAPAPGDGKPSPAAM